VALGAAMALGGTAGDAFEGTVVEARAEAVAHAKALQRWLDANGPYPRRTAPPRIRLILPEAAAALEGAAEARYLGAARGLFDPATGTVYLIKPWNPRNPRDVSVLLHELVHHRQAPGHWYCPQAQEWDAYRLQARWLEELGIEAGFYWPAIALESSCVRRDIHPD
jgi:hypothetical protein